MRPKDRLRLRRRKRGTPKRKQHAKRRNSAKSKLKSGVKNDSERRKRRRQSQRPSPNLPAESSPEAQAKRYQEDREICGLFPPSQIAKEYGLPVSADPVSIAEAYADGYQPQFHQAAFEGCLDGLGS